jgi:molybdate transport system substrate-binding protein
MADKVEIDALVTMGVREVYHELVPQFEAASGHKIMTSWTGTVDLMKRMTAGETHDVIFVVSTAVDELIRLGKVVPGSRADLASSGIGIAVKAGAPRPDVSSAAALKQALLTARTVGYSSGPSGIYIDGMLERLGIADDIKPKRRTMPSGGMIGDIIASGEAEIGFQQVSELLPIAGIDYLGPLPDGLQHTSVFSGAIPVGARQPVAAKELLAFFRTPSAAALIRRKGMEPAG